MMTDEQTVNVRFFGDKTEADVPATSCYLFSETRPRSRSSTMPKRMQKEYKDALKVIDRVFHRFIIQRDEKKKKAKFSFKM